MVQPNLICSLFCEFVLTTPWLKVTPAQTNLVQDVKDAADAPTPVTDHVWNEFLRVTGLWYQYYVAFREQTNGTSVLPANIAQGDMLYGSAPNVLVSLSKSTSVSRFIKNSGTSNNPAWEQPATTDLSDVTDWADFGGSSVVTGFSSITTSEVKWKKVGNIIMVNFFIIGVSNATNFTFTVPTACSASFGHTLFLTRTYFQGTWRSTPGIGYSTASSDIITLNANAVGNLYPATSVKGAEAQFFYAI